ncbi:HNH endonuclease [Bradyrhizobium guangxiense]
MRWMFFLLSFVASPVLAEEYITHPRWDLTPGVVRDLSVRQICRTKWGEDARGVTPAMKRNVIDAYRFDVNQCPLTTFRGKRVRRLEIDHLIPRSIGGADDERNLWPQCYEQVRPDKDEQENGAHKKDRLETFIHAELCRNPSDELLAEYQSKIRSDWISFYHEIYAGEMELAPATEIFMPVKTVRHVSAQRGVSKKALAAKKRPHADLPAKHSKGKVTKRRTKSVK